MKNSSADVYKDIWEVSFPNCGSFDNLDIAYSDFVSRLDWVINTIPPFKKVRIKNNASECFKGEMAEKINTRDKLYKNFWSTKLHVDEEICEETHNAVENLIRKESILWGKPKGKHCES